MLLTDMLYYASYRACASAIVGFVIIAAFIQSFRYHPGPTMKNLCFVFPPILGDTFHRIGWIKSFKLILPLSLVAIAGIVFAWLLVVTYVQRELILWSECDPEGKRTLLGRPLLFPSRLTHARIFPEKYHYWINYFLVGIPVGLRGRIGALMSIDSDGSDPHSPASKSFLCSANGLLRNLFWFRINTSMYLHRGDGHPSLSAKLEHFLKDRVCTPLIMIYTHAEISRARIQANILMRISLASPSFSGGRKARYRTGISTPLRRSLVQSLWKSTTHMGRKRTHFAA